MPARFHPIVQRHFTPVCGKVNCCISEWADIDWTVGVLTIHETKAGERRRVSINSVMQSLLVEMREAEKPTPPARTIARLGRWVAGSFRACWIAMRISRPRICGRQLKASRWLEPGVREAPQDRYY